MVSNSYFMNQCPLTSGWFNPKATAYWNSQDSAPTLVDGAISSLPDVTGNGNTATQGTAANRPYLSGASGEENRFSTVDMSNAGLWARTGLSNIVASGDMYSLVEDTSTGSHITFRSGTIDKISASTSYTVEVDVKKDARRWARVGLWFRDAAGGFISANRETYFDLDTVAFGTVDAAITASFTDLGSGVYRLKFVSTSPSNSFVIQTVIGAATADNTTSYTGTTSSAILASRPQLRTSTTSSTYIPTTTFPQYAGINGNRVPVFETNKSLTTSLAVNPTGGMWGIVVVRSRGNFAAATQQITTALISGSATSRLEVYTTVGAALRVNIHNAAPYTSYIGRFSADNAISANELFVLSWTYDGTTNATGIKIYKNGVQVDTTTASAGVYAVPTAGAVLVIGNNGNGTLPFNGYLLPAAFGQGGVISETNMNFIVRDLMHKYGIA